MSIIPERRERSDIYLHCQSNCQDARHRVFLSLSPPKDLKVRASLADEVRRRPVSADRTTEELVRMLYSLFRFGPDSVILPISKDLSPEEQCL